MLDIREQIEEILKCHLYNDKNTFIVGYNKLYIKTSDYQIECNRIYRPSFKTHRTWWGKEVKEKIYDKVYYECVIYKLPNESLVLDEVTYNKEIIKLINEKIKELEQEKLDIELKRKLEHLNNLKCQ